MKIINQNLTQALVLKKIKRNSMYNIVAFCENLIGSFSNEGIIKNVSICSNN